MSASSPGGTLSGVTLKGDPAQTQPVVLDLNGYPVNVTVTGDLTLEEAKTRVKHLIHHFARSQPLWFRPDDPAIVWVDSQDPERVGQAAAAVEAWVRT